LKNFTLDTITIKIKNFDVLFVLGILNTFKLIKNFQKLHKNVKIIGIPYGYFGDFPLLDYELGFHSSLALGKEVVKTAQIESYAFK